MESNPMNLPEGFVLDQQPDQQAPAQSINLPEGFVLDGMQGGEAGEPSGGGASFAKSFGEQMLEDAPAMAGSTALTLKTAGMLPATGLAALGGAAGEGYKQVYQGLTGSPEAPKTTGEAVTRMGKAGAEMALGEAGGRALVGVARKTAVPFLKDTMTKLSPKVTNRAQQAMEFLKKNIPEATLTPAEATESRALDYAQNIAEKSIIGGPTVAAKKEARDEAFKKFANSIAGERSDANVIGDLVEDEIRKGRVPFSAEVRKAFENLYNAAENVPINIKPLKQYANKFAKLSEESGGLTTGTTGADVMERLATREDVVPFSVAQEMRSNLMAMQRAIESIEGKSKKSGRINAAVKQVTKLIDDGLKQTDPKYSQMWKDARKKTAIEKAVFGNKLIERVLKKSKDNPEAVANMILRPEGFKAANRIKAAVSPEAFKKIQDFSVNKIIRDSRRNEMISGKKLSDNMQKYGEKTLAVLFGPERYKIMNEFANALNVAQKRQGEGAGSMLIQLMQATPIAQAASAGLVAGSPSGAVKALASPLLIGPEILARMIANPRTANMFIASAKVPPGTPQAAALTTKILNEARKAYEKYNQDKEQQQ